MDPLRQLDPPVTARQASFRDNNMKERERMHQKTVTISSVLPVEDIGEGDVANVTEGWACGVRSAGGRRVFLFPRDPRGT